AAPFAFGNKTVAASPSVVRSRPNAAPAPPLPATVADVEPPKTERVESSDDFYRALATIFATSTRIFAFLFGLVFSFFKRCVAALWRSSTPTRTRLTSGTIQLGRDAARSFAAIFTPTTRWSENAPPNFLLPSLVLFFLWTRPCALVAVVYSILSNEARQSDATNVAWRRAVSARIWIFLELLCVALKALFEAFDMSLPILKRLFF
ncbi:MAG: hypothetical protein IKY61_01435, partial [Thermoguttaceae bacterium]|nr:hypothetical protein [Thermoguttaceae bacterium]